MNRMGECTRCGVCCQTVNITAVRDVALAQHRSLDELKLYLSYRGIRVVGEDEKNNLLFYSLDVPCRQLTPDNRCRVHNTPQKPLLCYRYPWERDDVEECGYTFA
ncbi:MAG: YkgJ family cysteine cluster protein [Nitrospinales bacterium]